MEIVLATRNKKKIEEIIRIASGLPVTILSLADYPNCPEVEEDKDTFEGNAVKKAVEIAECTGKIALADDSGLEVEALGGAPGVYSARYAGEAGDAEKNYEKLLSELTAVPDGKKGAQFVCCMALAYPDGEVKTFFGYARGKIGREPRGKKGFGYDPVFFPEGYDKTFAEMSADEKDRLSHRGIALKKLFDFLRSGPFINKTNI
jgi:XTP/dITP diphosphohydrolase